MALISYIKIWESEFENFVIKRDKLQGLNINQFKIEVHDSYIKDEKITTKSEPVNREDVINKS